jgi:hypothetical protein
LEDNIKIILVLGWKKLEDKIKNILVLGWEKVGG